MSSVAGEPSGQIYDADRLAFLIDGEAYYRAVAEACEAAQRSIYILGWDVDSRIRLRRGKAATEESFGAFIDGLARTKPQLDIYILEWDFSMLYSLEREAWTMLSFGWMTHERVRFALDDNHPVGASHHQKIVVVDDLVAFTGGFDLASFRWDTSEHRPEHPQRVDNGTAYGPVHDVQVAVSGAAATALGNIARQRWERATGDRLAPPGKVAGDPWPESVSIDLEQIPLTILRTAPEHDGATEVREIEQFYLAAIAAAKTLIYIENQYFSSHVIGQALAASLQRETGPEILLVLPRKCPGWLEEETMGLLRDRLLKRLQEADSHGRLRACYPDRRQLDPEFIIVHSKLMIVDDVLLTVGSANISNRSMGFDTECNIALDGRENAKIAAGIKVFRQRLLAEHLGTDCATVAEARQRDGSLSALLALSGDGVRTLKKLEPADSSSALATLPADLIADPEQPIGFDSLLVYLGWAENGEKDSGDARQKARQFIAVILLALLLAVLWRWSPVGHWLSVDSLVAAAQYVQQSPLAIPIVLSLYLLGSCLMVPVNLLILATALSFGPYLGFGLALSGSLIGGMASYFLGHWLGSNAVRKLAGKKINRLSRKLAQKGWLAVALVRVVPIAPFTVVNMVAGASHISARSFLFGTAIGMCPGILAIMIFEEGLQRALAEWSWGSLIPVGLAVLFGGLVFYGGRRLLLQREAQRK